MIPRLTLSEMAAFYKKTPKTFKRHVLKSGIPHELIGRSMMFDLSTVIAHVAAQTPDPAKVVKFKPSVRKSRTRKISKFAEAVGV